MSYKERVKITDRPLPAEYKNCFVLHVEGYHGDMDYNVNEESKFRFDEDSEDEAWEYLVQSYIGYKAMKDLKPRYGGSPDIDEVYKVMKFEDEYGFDWPINPYDNNCGEYLMTVTGIDVVYYNENGQPFEVEIA